MTWRSHPWLNCVLACVVLFAGACTSAPAPVEDRSHSPSRPALGAGGQYRVKRGDSLFAIAFRFGLDYRDLAVWNNIRSPYTIYPDQLLSLKPPADKVKPAVVQTPAGGQLTGSAPPGKIVSAPKPVPVPPGKLKPEPVTSEPASTPAAKPAPPAVSQPGTIRWQWPVSGRVVRNYLANDPSRNGLDISGSEGQAVVSAAPGTVVYSGAGLIGYGELIIIKHSEEFLSAYAHNRRRLVEEGDSVSTGQKIAEMGKNDRNETVLHFEIRVNGRPVDPRKYLPKP